MEWCRIDEFPNPPDLTGRGCVPYAYEIAKYAVTNADWCAFLNAVGAEVVARHKLYHKDMTTAILGGIDVADGRCSPKAGWEKKPVVYVNYLSLLRYCNWLQTGETETGAYDLTVMPPRRQKGARYFLPTADEWYKAAYYDCSNNGVKYWKYPTCTNEIPSQAQANFERGDCFSPAALTPCGTQANTYFYFADVDAFSDCPSPWGAVQMGGNAWEFLENVWERSPGVYENTLRGGSFGYTETGLDRGNTDTTPFNTRTYVFGARLAHMPEGWRPVRKPLRFVIMFWVKSCLRRVVRKLRCFG